MIQVIAPYIITDLLGGDVLWYIGSVNRYGTFIMNQNYVPHTSLRDAKRAIDNGSYRQRNYFGKKTKNNDIDYLKRLR